MCTKILIVDDIQTNIDALIMLLSKKMYIIPISNFTLDLNIILILLSMGKWQFK